MKAVVVEAAPKRSVTQTKIVERDIMVYNISMFVYDSLINPVLLWYANNTLRCHYVLRGFVLERSKIELFSNPIMNRCNARVCGDLSAKQ